jgi:hypothetical protein
MKVEPAASGAGTHISDDTRVETRADTNLMRSLLVGIFIFMAI